MGFIKYFYDGSKYVATDTDIANHKASWRNSRNTEIKQVDITNGKNETVLRLCGRGDYWQSDKMEISVPFGIPKILSRNVQKKITSGDFIYTPHYHNGLLTVDITTSFPVQVRTEIHTLIGQDIGRWLTLIYEEDSGRQYFKLMDHQL